MPRSKHLLPTASIAMASIAAIACAILGACADPTPYREPAVGPTARVTVVGAGIRFETIDATDCPGIVRQELSLPIGMADGITRLVPAQQRWIVAAEGLLEGRTCGASAAFEPQAGRHYEVRLVPAPGAKCLIEAREFADDAQARASMRPVKLEAVDSTAGYCPRACSVGRADATRAACLTDPHGAIDSSSTDGH